MTKLFENKWLLLLSRLVLSGVLIYAGGIKLVDPVQSRAAIVAYRLYLPEVFVKIATYGLPAFEVVVGMLLLLGIFVRFSALATIALMAVFIVMIAQVWYRGFSIDCGCFGGGGDVSPEGKEWRYTSEILRDLLFMGFAVLLARKPQTPFSISA
ncbi:MAG: hypothetical protein RL228_1181 [Actinomycetota bacterium]|jgi:uncharacterized membrane protein YphA (DoxX/SURF4 family)